MCAHMIKRKLTIRWDIITTKGINPASLAHPIRSLLHIWSQWSTGTRKNRWICRMKELSTLSCEHIRHKRRGLLHCVYTLAVGWMLISGLRVQGLLLEYILWFSFTEKESGSHTQSSVMWTKAQQVGIIGIIINWSGTSLRCYDFIALGTVQFFMTTVVQVTRILVRGINNKPGYCRIKTGTASQSVKSSINYKLQHSTFFRSWY